MVFAERCNDNALLLFSVMAQGGVQTYNARHDIFTVLEAASHKVDEEKLHEVITEEMIIDNPRVTQNPEVCCQWNWCMAIQRPLASIQAYVIDWDFAIDLDKMASLYGTKPRHLHLDYYSGPVNDRRSSLRCHGLS